MICKNPASWYTLYQVECAATFLHTNTQEIRRDLRDYVRKMYGNATNNFFPSNGCWYKYPNIEIDRSTNERPFISMGSAVYR